MQTATPRPYMPSPVPGAALARVGSGMPQERLARLAARRTFVDLKQHFMKAVADVPGSRGDWLRYQVRQANDPVDLWLLRGAVFAVLPARVPESRRMRLDLHRALDTVFPDSGDIDEMLPL
ncbi:MAG: hypothetical protein U1E89_17645 [Burkholderiaceae bacterium]